MHKTIFVLMLASLAASPVLAQDPVKVDPKHYSVALENKNVRVLKITYGPHEKSVMHSHPDAVAIFLTDATLNFTLGNGKTEERKGKAGDVLWTPAEKHLPENTGDSEVRVILVEMKHPRMAAAKKK
jgi:quercetin dioxygenase-like cupin family protein